IQGSSLIRHQYHTFLLMIKYAVKGLSNHYHLTNTQIMSFYWDVIIPAYHEFLTTVDLKNQFDSFSKSDEKKKKDLFYPVFGRLITIVFSPRNNRDDSISKFHPLVVKHGEIDWMKHRFIQKNLNRWDKAFEWVLLHINGSKLLKNTDPEKSKILLMKASDLVDQTLSSGFCTYNRALWEAREKEALKLIAEAEEAINTAS
ncbi:MAG: hypothetical protein KDK50_02065, partial [Chlamydiia bacterium]|nr:hypothetical protein [Chlamydiia bacterium]